MAITQTGTVLRFTPTTANSGTVSSTITVPDDAQFIAVGVSGYAGVANYFSGGNMYFTKGGTATTMSKVTGGDASTACYMSAMFYLALPDTGANKELAWDWTGTGAADNAPLVSVTFWKGIDTASPVRDSDGVQAASTPYTTPTLTAQTGDKIVAWTGYYAGIESEFTSWTRLSTLENLTIYGNSDGAWATGDPTGNNTVAAVSGNNVGLDGGLLAIVLIPSSGITISATQAATVGESITATIANALTVSVTDGATVTDTGISFYYPIPDVYGVMVDDLATTGEVVGAKLADNLTISKTDAATVGEALTLYGPYSAPYTLSVTDAVIVSDGLFNGWQFYEVSQPEAVTVGEAATVSLSDPGPASLSVIDGVTAGETVNARMATALAVNATDSASLGEICAAEISTSLVNKTDGATVADSTPSAILSTALITCADAVALGESLAASLPDALAANKTDGVTVVEVAPSALLPDALAVNKTDGASAGEVVTLPEIGAVAASVTDTANLGEDVTVEFQALPALGIAIDPADLLYWISGVKVVG